MAELLPSRVDVLVIGAGTAGVAVAAHAAERGLSVVCLDRGALEEAGARWVNAVPAWAFEAAAIAAPRPPELRGGPGSFHMLAGHGPARIVVSESAIYDVDMRLLRARLQRDAEDAGAIVRGEVEIGALEGGALRTSLGTIHARFVVDASGLAGARLLDPPAPLRRDLCTAAQAVHRIADPSGARAFLDAHEIAEGDTVCRAGIAGGYSILNVSVHGSEVSILTGTVPADGHPSGRAVLDEFVRAQTWIGERIFGGHRAIPLGRPHDVIARGNVAAIGDAARQVFSAHGSGIGAGLVAARMLVDAIADGGGPEAYAALWQRTYGGLFAAYDLFRRFSQELTVEDLSTMMTSGWIDPQMTVAGMTQQLPRLDPKRIIELAPRARGAPSERRIARRVVTLGARVAAVLALYAAYPRRGPRTRWSAAVARACGDARWRTS